MKDFLENKTSSYSGLRLQQIVVLLEIISEAELTTRENIRKRFLERAPEFESTLSFLLEIGAVHSKDSQLSMVMPLMENSSNTEGKNLAREIVNLMTRRENRYQSEVFEYLMRFEVKDGKASYRPSPAQRGELSAVRNFLMELGIVLYDKSTLSYFISPEGNSIFAQAKCRTDSFSVSEFQASRQVQEDIGLAAERAVVTYERQRVGPKFANEVEHVAHRNVAAGYDIRSVSFCSEYEVIPRYIEVKAVPPETYCFYWTLNELNVARIFRSWYYLYLLPVKRSGVMSLEELWIIKDPCSVVLESHDEWIIEKNVLRCSVKPSLKKATRRPGVNAS